MRNSVRILRPQLTKKMKDKQNSVTSFSLFDQKLNRIHAIHLSHALRGALLVVMVMICACGVASGQIFFPGGEDHITIDLNAGPQGNGRILCRRSQSFWRPRRRVITGANKHCKRDDFLLNLGGCRQ